MINRATTCLNLRRQWNVVTTREFLQSISVVGKRYLDLIWKISSRYLGA